MCDKQCLKCYRTLAEAASQPDIKCSKIEINCKQSERQDGATGPSNGRPRTVLQRSLRSTVHKGHPWRCAV